MHRQHSKAARLSRKSKSRWRRSARWALCLARCLRGIDRVDNLFAAFAEETAPSFIRLECVRCLQQWIALGRDNDYQLLEVVRKDYPKQASMKIVELFHLISQEDARNPGTYQVLIEDLNNDLLPIRFLSYWHLQLYPLAPAGSKAFPMDAALSRPRPHGTVQACVELIPPGQRRR